MRFSVRWLLIFILAIAVGVVALLNANEYWAGAARSTLILLLSLATAIASLSTGSRRAFWIGFAVFGWIQFASVGFAKNLERETTSGYLLTDQGIEWLHSKLVRNVEILVPIFNAGVQVRTQPAIVRRPHIDYFNVVARCLLVAFLGTLGGYVATWIFGRSNPLGATLAPRQS